MLTYDQSTERTHSWDLTQPFTRRRFEHEYGLSVDELYNQLVEKKGIRVFVRQTGAFVVCAEDPVTLSCGIEGLNKELAAQGLS